MREMWEGGGGIEGIWERSCEREGGDGEDAIH